MEFGEGDGEHWVSLLVANQEPTPVSVEVAVRSETIYEESVELGGDRYTSYEFKYPASYSLLVTLNEHELELAVNEDSISHASGDDTRVSGQTYCLTTEGTFEQQRW
jgi:hypothetical protein